MSQKIIAGAAALALATVPVIAEPASARNWQGNGNVVADCGCYQGYAYALGYGYPPPSGYSGAYDSSPWSYRGGPHPR